jgi:hypothetical protein
MKKFMALFSVATVLGLAAPALAADPPVVTETVVTAPVQCEGMIFDHTITATDRQVVDGTNDRDLIVVGNSNKVDGKGGADCIVVGRSNAVVAGGGADVVVVNGTSNKASGGAGADKMYALAGSNKLLGEGGNDLLSGVGNTSVDGGAGTDECHTDTLLGKQNNCESASAAAVGDMSPLAMLLSLLGL